MTRFCHATPDIVGLLFNEVGGASVREGPPAHKGRSRMSLETLNGGVQ